MTCLYVATINTTQWSVIGHAEGWHFLIPGVQLRFNDFHCLELLGGSGEVIQRGLCHLKGGRNVGDILSYMKEYACFPSN